MSSGTLTVKNIEGCQRDVEDLFLMKDDQLHLAGLGHWRSVRGTAVRACGASKRQR
jgi:hypothetical protein